MMRMVMVKLRWKVCYLNLSFDSMLFQNKYYFKEYVNACRKNGNTSSDDVLRKSFKLFDTDDDGEIFLDEFIAVFKYINEKKESA